MSSASQRVRLTVTVSKATDREVRAILGARRVRKGELSKFVEQAVQAQLFRMTLDDIKRRNKGIDTKQLRADIDRAVREVRSERGHLPQRKRVTSTKNAAVA